MAAMVLSMQHRQ